MNMKAYNKFLILGFLVLFAACAQTVEVPKTVKYDYNVNVDFAKLKSYDFSPMPTTVGIEELMMARIKAAIDTQLQAKNVKKTSNNPDFLVTVYGVRTRIFTTAWRGFDSDLIIEKGKLVVEFVDPKTDQILWWGETRAILDPNTKPENETQMVNDVVHRILQKFPPASS
jgi:hypothetical protein